MYEVIHILFAILCIVEAKLESIVIRMKNPNMFGYDQANKQEHFWSAVYYFAVVGITIGMSVMMVGFRWELILVVVSLLATRRLFFDNPLKFFRSPRRRLSAIEGDMPLDRFMRNVFGRNGGYVDAFLMLGIVIGIYFLTHKVF